jgi:hypothetical protein
MTETSQGVHAAEPLEYQYILVAIVHTAFEEPAGLGRIHAADGFQVGVWKEMAQTLFEKIRIQSAAKLSEERRHRFAPRILLL